MWYCNPHPMRQYIFRSNSEKFVINSDDFNFACLTTERLCDQVSNQEPPVTLLNSDLKWITSENHNVLGYGAMFVSNYSFSKRHVCWDLRACESRLLNSSLYPYLGWSICRNAVCLELHKATHHSGFRNSSRHCIIEKLAPRCVTAVNLLE